MAGLESSQITRNRRAQEDIPDNRNFRNRAVREIHREIRTNFENIDQDSAEVIEELNTVETLKEFASLEVDKPSFPVRIFSIALFFDLLDISQLTGVGWFIMVVINFLFGVYLFFWMTGKLSTMFKASSKGLFTTRLGKAILAKSARKYLTKRLAYIFVFNILPFIGILASNAFFVFLAHNHMNKIAKMYIELIENAGKKLKEYRRP